MTNLYLRAASLLTIMSLTACAVEEPDSIGVSVCREADVASMRLDELGQA